MAGQGEINGGDGNGVNIVSNAISIITPAAESDEPPSCWRHVFVLFLFGFLFFPSSYSPPPPPPLPVLFCFVFLLIWLKQFLLVIFFFCRLTTLDNKEAHEKAVAYSVPCKFTSCRYIQ